MFGWSINLFHIRGIQLAVHWSFLLLLGYAGWDGWRAAGGLGLAWTLSYVTLMFTCVVLHELGHALMARRFGVDVPRILLLPIGGMAEFDYIPRRPRSEILIALAGPAVNVAIAAVLMIFVRFPAEWNPFEFALTIEELGRHLVLMNVGMLLFNLIPVFPMDGGRVFRALLAQRFPYVRATEIAATVAKVLAVVGILYMAFHGTPNYLGCALFVFIAVVGEMELRAVRLREFEDQHWRMVMRRFAALAASAEPPPPAISRP